MPNQLSYQDPKAIAFVSMRDEWVSNDRGDGEKWTEPRHIFEVESEGK